MLLDDNMAESHKLNAVKLGLNLAMRWAVVELTRGSITSGTDT